MTAPKRVQMTRHRPWRAENPDAVIVDRRTKWGNPFKAGVPVDRATQPTLYLSLHNTLDWDSSPQGEIDRQNARTLTPATAQQAVYAYVDWLLNEEELWLQAMDELGGKDLACWCPLEADDGTRVPCHADALMELANVFAEPDDEESEQR